MDLAIDSNELVLRNQADQNNNSEVPNHLIVQAIYKLNQTQMQHGERLNNVEQEIFKIQQKLCIAGIETQSNINATINSIRITNPKLYKYYSYFNSGLQNIYIASQVIDSKLVVPDADHMEHKKFNKIEKGFCYTAEVAAFFFKPYINAIITVGHDAVDNIFNTSAEKTLKKALENYNCIIKKQYDYNLTIEQNIQQLVLFYTHIKEQEILSIEKESTKEGFLSFIAKKLLPVRHKLFDYTNQDTDDPVINLAFKDLTALVTYMQEYAQKMIESPLPFVAQIADRVKEELTTYYDNKIKTNQVNTIEYNLLQIENRLSESTKITEKIEKGQWDNTPLALISFNFWSIWSFWSLDIIRISTTREQRGIQKFATKEYYKAECVKSGINATENDLDNFMLLLLHKICKSGNKECITQFKQQNSNIIELARVNAPQLFVTTDAIDICITDSEKNEEAKGILALKSPEKLFADCFKKMFPSLNIEDYKKEESLIEFDMDSPRSETNVNFGGNNAIEYNNPD